MGAKEQSGRTWSSSLWTRGTVGMIGNEQEWLRIVVNDPVIDENLVGIFKVEIEGNM